MKIKLSQLRSIIREEVENAMNTTTFECRLCGDTIQGEASPEGPGKAGWSSLAGIDGPRSVCPECAERVRQDPSELDDFRDEYPNVRLAENLRKEVAGERIELLISQARDEFTDMMGGGTYYEDSGWPSEDEDPNCTLTQFDSAEEAMRQGQSTIDELNETDDPHAPTYRALVYRIGPRGKRTLVSELT